MCCRSCSQSAHHLLCCTSHAALLQMRPALSAYALAAGMPPSASAQQPTSALHRSGSRSKACCCTGLQETVLSYNNGNSSSSSNLCTSASPALLQAWGFWLPLQGPGVVPSHQCSRTAQLAHRTCWCCAHWRCTRRTTLYLLLCWNTQQSLLPAGRGAQELGPLLPRS